MEYTWVIIVEKIAKAYSSEGPSRALRAGDFVSIRPRHVMTHDNTSAVIKKFKAIGAKRIHNHQQPVFALDHDIQNHSEENLKKYAAIEAFAREHHIDFYPAGTGIGHQIMVERGYVVPGILRRGQRLAFQYVWRAWGYRDTGGSDGRRRYLGDRRILVAGSAEHPGRSKGKVTSRE